MDWETDWGMENGTDPQCTSVSSGGQVPLTRHGSYNGRPREVDVIPPHSILQLMLGKWMTSLIKDSLW